MTGEVGYISQFVTDEFGNEGESITRGGITVCRVRAPGGEWVNVTPKGRTLRGHELAGLVALGEPARMTISLEDVPGDD